MSLSGKPINSRIGLRVSLCEDSPNNVSGPALNAPARNMQTLFTAKPHALVTTNRNSANVDRPIEIPVPSKVRFGKNLKQKQFTTFTNNLLHLQTIYYIYKQFNIFTNNLLHLQTI